MQIYNNIAHKTTNMHEGNLSNGQMHSGAKTWIRKSPLQFMQAACG